MTTPANLLVAVCFCFATLLSFGQSRTDQVKKASVHIGISQGIGTNGIHDLSYRNDFALSLISGQSYGNNILLISGLTHFLQQEANGLILTGFSSTVGGYPFLKRSKKVDSLASFQAIQISGFANAVHGGGYGAQVSTGYNYVSDNLDGTQISGLYNKVERNFGGLQMAGLISSVKHLAVGVQVSGLANSTASLSGIQVGTFLNIVKNDLDGLQIGAINYTGNIKSTVYRANRFYWLQGGIVNLARSNGDGTQIGLINFGKDVGFSQIGLINISRNAPQYPVGLLNLSVTGNYFLRAYSNRGHRYNIEFASGSDKLINAVSYSFGSKDDKNALGYHLGKLRYWGWNKYEYFDDIFVYVKFHHPSLKDLLDSETSYGLKYEWGYNPFVMKKGIDLFLFAGLSCNVQHIRVNPSVSDFMSWEMGKIRGWLDFNLGIQL